MRRGAVERSLHIVETLIEAATPMSIVEIAGATGLESNSVHRLLQKLLSAGYVYRDAATRKFHAARRALCPITLHHPLNNLRQEAREQLRVLRERCYESVYLVVFIGNERVTLDVIQSREAYNPLFETRVGTRLHSSATGIILLKDLSAKERRDLLGDEPFSGPGVNPVRTYADLEAKFKALQVDGYTVAQGTAMPGINAVAAPISDQNTAIGCLAITGSSETITEDRLKALGEALRDSANVISLGAPAVKAVARFLGH